MSVEFEPVKLGRQRRRLDPVAVGLAVVVIALVVAVVKPWGDVAPRTGSGPGPATSEPPTTETSVDPDNSPPFAEPPPPAWADVVPVVSRRDEWGIRAIVFGPAAGESGVSRQYAERWIAAGAGERGAMVLDVRDARVIALGVTFPPAETPLDVRIWQHHADRDLEWIDARPLNEVPARGAYLFLRDGIAGTTMLPWEPGRYRVDVLVGDEIRRFDVEILGQSGAPPEPEAWPEAFPRGTDFHGSGLEGLPVGPFVWADGAALSLASAAGPVLDEAGAWLDVDWQAADQRTRSFVARTSQRGASWLGVVLPAPSTIQTAFLNRLAPLEGSPDIGATVTTSGDGLSFVAFSRLGGVAWRPGVYALRVEFVDDDGANDLTWHIELRPGPVQAEPVLLAATRAWAGLAGSRGVLLGTTEAIDRRSEMDGIRLLDIAPETAGPYAGLRSSNLVGCGETYILGRPTVIGFVAPEGADLGPITSTILFPLADDGPLPVLTAAGAVPGLAIAAPVLTAEFGGPALYGFRADQSPDASGYTICIGMAPPGR